MDRALRRTIAASASAALVAASMAMPAVGGYPARDARYHSYPEMVAALERAEARHPAIVRTFSIGRSHEGRRIMAVEISDRPGVDEGEPEVLFDGLHHAREHLTAEQALDIVELLTSRYGKGGSVGRRVTKLVDRRRIWIVPMLNPDGLVHDLTGSPYRSWRKNRQPTPGSGRIGTDLNRNWGYRWGCCRGSSRNPASDTYRGPRAWSAPEVRALRDFVDSRVVDGRQRIRTHITFHTAGELVLWPYAYTRANVPADMTSLDQRALRALGRQMAKRNGYRARQSSAAFRTDGDMIDWMYGKHRLFSYTFELYPRGGSARARHHPPDEVIGRQTKRNRGAILDLIGRASCPYSILGRKAQQKFCGPLFDDLEVDRGWRVDPDGDDDANAGAWVRGKPQASPRQLGTTRSGRSVLITGRRKGFDVDGGTTTVRSPLVAIPAGGATVRLAWWVGLGQNADAEDGMAVHLVDEDGVRRATLLEVRGGGDGRSPRWRNLVRSVPPGLRGGRIAIELEARDTGGDATVEAAIDQVRITLD